jgi:hypothetical protein
MGRIAQLLSFLRQVRNGANVSDVKVDPGGAPVITAEHYSSIGEDAHPLPGDFVALIGAESTGRETAVAYLDTKNLAKSEPGDYRIYARSQGTKDQVVELWLRNTSDLEISNDNGHIILQADGEVNINGARITTDGDVITASGVSLKNHPHDQGADSHGDSEVPTDPPTPTE